MKKAFIIVPWLLLLCIVLSASACDYTPAQTSSESDQVNDQQTTYANNQQLHHYDYSPERDELQQIYDARMKLTNTWTVIFNKTWNQWGAFDYKEADDALRVTVPNVKPASPSEKMTFNVGTDGKVNLAWGGVGFNFRVM